MRLFNWRKSLRGILTARTAPLRRESRTRLCLEQLEDRTLLSTVNWLNPSGGNWDVGSNWVGGSVPGSGDDAVINTAAAATITIKSGDNISVHSVTTAANDTLSITGGALSVTDGTSTLSGPLSMTGGSLTADGTGVTFTATATTAVSGASLYAKGGATLSLPGVTSYANPSNSAGSATFEATGTGSTLALPELATLGSLANSWYVEALSGGQVNLSSVSAINDAGYVDLEADGSSSQLDLSALTSFARSGGGQSSLQVTNNGTVLDGKLTSLNQVSISLDGTGTLATSQWTALTNGSLTLSGGALTLSGLNVDGTNLEAESGGQLSLPTTTSFAVSSSARSSATFEATGTGSTLALPELATLGSLANSWYVEALSGGQINLSSVSAINDAGYVDLEADGSSSQINLSALTSFARSGQGQSSLQVTNNGTVLDGKLTSLNQVSVSLDGTGMLATSQWTALTNGSLTLSGGALTLSGLNVNGSNLEAESGGQLSLPTTTSFAVSSSARSNATFEATGTGSTLALPELATLGSLANSWYVQALSGGQINLSAVSAISDAGYVDLEADGSSSQIDLSALTSFARSGGGQSSLQVTNSGTILDGKLTSLNQVSVSLDGTGTLATSQWTALTNGSLTLSGGALTLSGLNVNGSNLEAESGGQLSLPTTTSFAVSSSARSNATFEATGTGSTLALPELATLGSLANSWYVQALSGGQINLSAVSAISDAGYVDLEADGSSSQIDLSALTSFARSGGGQSSLQVTNSGTILDGKLTSLNQVSVSLDGTGTLATSQWTALTNGSLTLSGGALTLSGLNVNGSNLEAESGGQLSLPTTTTFAVSSSARSSATFEATGTGSTLALPELATLGSLANSWYVEALSGGQINLSAVSAISDAGYVDLEADGSSSQIDLSALTSFARTGGGQSSLQVTNSGTVLDGKLTSLNAVSVSLDGTGTLATSQWTALTNGSLTLSGGTLALSGLNVNGSNLEAESGGQLSLPTTTSFANPSTSRSSATFEATGTGSTLALPELATLGSLANSWYVQALSGGQINLSAVPAISDAGYVDLEADGSSSQINLSALTSFARTGGSDSSVQVTNSGTLLTGNLTTLSGVNVTVDGTGTWDTSSITSASNGTYTLLGYGPPSSGNAVTINVPALPQGLQGLDFNLSLNESYTGGTTVNIPAADTVNMSGGTFAGGTIYNVGAGTTLGLSSATFTGGIVFNVAQGAAVDLTGGTISGTLTGTGLGTVELSGSINIGLGGLTLNFTGSMFQWTGGGMFAALGNVTNQGTLNLAGSSDKGIYEDATLFNYGTIIQTGTGNLDLHSDNVTPTTLDNEAGASYLIESDSGIDNANGGTTGLVNAGTIRKTAGTGTSTLDINGVLNNTGTIEADTGTLYLDANSITQISGGSLAAGTWNALGGATLQFPTGTAITSNAGNVTLGGSGATITGITGLATNSGSFTVTNGAGFTTVADFSNSGSLTVGAGSTLTVTGNFTQTSAGTLNVQIGGTPASGQFGLLAVTKAVALAGAFDLALSNGFTPSNGQQFNVVTFASVTGTFASFTGLSPYFTQTLTGTAEELATTAAPADLVTSNVAAPTTATAGQQITVTWKVTDQSGTAVTGTWQDSVYLSTTPSITSTSLLLGAATHTGGLAANAFYNGTFTATVPAVPPGAYYVLVQADSLYQTPDSNRANGIAAASTGQLQVSVPALTLGTPLSDSFTAADQDHYYQLSVPAGGSLSVALSSNAASGAVALYVGQGTLPTPFNFQDEADVANQPNQTVVVPQVLTAGTYYILAHSVSGAAATAGFTLTATQGSAVSISAISSYSGGNAGNVTVEIDGANFIPSATATLSLGAATITATAVDFVNASQLFATFNLTGAAAGSYTLKVQQGAQSARAAATFQVVAVPSPAPLSVALVVPQFIRAGRTGTIVITYTNPTNNDMVAPLLDIESTNTSIYFSTPDDPNDFTQDAQVLAVATSGPAGILRPGQSGQLTLTLLSDDTVNNDEIPVQVSQIEAGQTIDWASQEASLQPASIPTAAWNVIFNNVLATVGSTTDSYNAALAQAATYLSGLGETTAQASDVGSLWSFLVSQASASFPTATLSSAVDASLSTPGNLSLAIDRTFVSTIAGRYTQGIFGLGWTTSWQSSLSADSSGNVTINSGGALSFFVLQANGSYLDTAGEYASLTRSAGIYTFTDTSGTQYVFLPGGQLNYVQDTNGNRITLGYNAQNQLISLIYSNSAVPSEQTEELALTYNPQGFVALVTDSTGNTWGYSYDTAGHLLSVTAPGPTAAGLTTSYSYDTGSNPETANALLSITNPDGSQQAFTYSATTGQLTGTSQSGGVLTAQASITYAYLGQAEVTATDAAGDQTTVWFNNLGLPSRVQDPRGGITTYLYDQNGNLIGSTDAAGDTYQYSYDQNGNLTQIVNPLGQTVQMTYNSLSDLTSLTDADDNTTQYGYGSTGNLLSITYPDGTQQTFTYDPLGNLSETVLQNGDPINYQVNSQGLVTKEAFADGTSQTFTYDAHGNLLTANTFNGGGTLTGTTTLTYNAANELLSITYPNGQFLKFTYNAQGQRTQSVDQSGYTLSYSYDGLGRLVDLSDGSGMVVNYTYNNLGQLSEKQNGNGTYTTYAYDAAGNLLSEVNYATGTTVNSSFTYTYNLLGEQTSVTDNAGNTTLYAYDATGQLTQITMPGGATIQYVYNAAGDRTEVVNSGTPTSYASNADNEITQVGSATYTYDANGNLASVTDASGTTTYTYNDLNQLVSIAAPGGNTTTFQYSPLGFLVGTSVNGTQTNYLVDPTGLGNVVASYNGSGALIAHYNYGLGLVSQTGPSGTGYYDFDASGNTVGITGASGTYVNQYSYLPFGETTTISAALPNPFTFVGQFRVIQIGTNLFYMRARDYTPATGQFMSNDPLGILADDTNLRRYVGNEPVNRIDPEGLEESPAVTITIEQAAEAGFEVLSGAESPGFSGALPLNVGAWSASTALNALTALSADPAKFKNLFKNHSKEQQKEVAKKLKNDPTNYNKLPPELKTFIDETSHDPNALIGPAGYGTQNFIADSGNLPYTIDFENDGSVAAQDVTVTEQLDPNLNWSTFQLGSFGFGPVSITIPAGLTDYETTVAYQNIDGSSLNVQVALDFNVQTGLLTVTFTSLDPATGQAPTAVTAGFLPPDNASGVGEGFVQYTVQPKATLTTGATINQQAAVVFDTNAAIDTATVTNTIDAGPPTSSVATLPPVESSPFFTVSWAGTDDTGGSGIASYTIYVSDDGGPFTPFLTDTTQTSTTFTGVNGNSYAFYSVATDNVGNVQATPATAQTITTVVLPPEFVYNQTTSTLAITLIPSLPNFTFSQATTASGTSTSTFYTFTLSGTAPSVTETFTDAQFTTSPASGAASVSVIGQGLAGTAILITNDTYVDQNGQKQQTPARISLGSLTDDGAGTVSKFVGNNLNNPEYTFLSLENFPLSYAYAGRNDGTIQLFGTEGTGKVGFVTAGYYSYIASAVTGVYAHFGEGTPEVVGTSAGNADDFAYHYTSSSPSTVSSATAVFTVNGITSSSMQGSQTNPEDGGAIDTFDNIANGFVLNTAVAYSRNSIAHINDSSMSDTYVGEATDPLGLASIGGIAGFSYMYVGAFPAFSEFDVAYGFGTYYASSTMGGHDIDYPGEPANNVFSGNWIQSFS